MAAINEEFDPVITTEKYDDLNDMEFQILQLKKLKTKLDDTKISRLFESTDYTPLTETQNSIFTKFMQTAERVELLQKRVDASNNRVYLRQGINGFVSNFTNHGSDYACGTIKRYLDVNTFANDYQLPEHASAVGQLMHDLLENVGSRPEQKTAAEEMILSYLTQALNSDALTPQHKTEIVIGLLSHDVLTSKASQSVLATNGNQLDMKKLIDTTSDTEWHSKSHTPATNRVIAELRASSNPNSSHMNYVKPHTDSSKPAADSCSADGAGMQHSHSHKS